MTEVVTVQDKMVVGIHYTLTNGTGEELDTSIGFEPLYYLHGAQNVVSGLESGLLGLAVGAKTTVIVEPKDGYGEKNSRGAVAVPKTNFPPNMEIQPRMMFHTEGPDGQPVPLWVTEVTDTDVMVDTDHPLAGVTLTFEVEVVEVRAASDAELSDGQVHPSALN